MNNPLESGSIFKGEVTSLKDATLSISQEQDKSNTLELSNGNDLWEYQNMHKYCGIPVAEDCLDLPIDSDELLHRALILSSVPDSVVLRLSPDDTDGITKYGELLKRQATGELRIIEETKNYDASNACFIVLITYEVLEYKLHPRYDFLRTELKEY